jgi:glucose/mannose-6-phosphate isomerase
VSVLDDPKAWLTCDARGMRTLLTGFPSQFEEAVNRANALALAPAKNVRQVVVTGLGGSAIGGDVIRTVAGESLRIPLIVNRDYRLPAFVDASTLVFACSYSGNTEETLSAYEDAKLKRAALIAITTGGELGKLASSDGFPVITVPPGLPPRAALGYSAVALLSALGALGLTADTERSLRETVALLPALANRYGPEVPEGENPAKAMARSLHGKIVAIYASSGILDAAAVRWRGQIEENAKNLAFHHVLPEMNHNELVGWKRPEELLMRVGVVFLRDQGDHPQVQRRFELTKGILSAKAGVVHEVWSKGSSLLARIFSTIYLGDFVSLYLAWLNGEDAMPVEVIDYLKKSLGS